MKYKLILIGLLVMIFELFNQYSFAKDPIEIDENSLVHVFYNGTDYNAEKVKEALLSYSNVMQRIMGRKDVSATELYDGEVTTSTIKNIDGFYDPDHDTIFININKINLTKARKYWKSVKKLNELRFDLQNTNPTDADRWTKFRAEAWTNENYFHLKYSGGSKKIKMDNWLKDNRGSPIILLGTAKAQNAASFKIPK